MKFTDLSPPSSPSLDEQTDALRKGLGRAMTWAAAGILDEDLLFHASLHDLRYDSQVDSNRAPWLWRLLVTTDTTERFRTPLLNALQSLSDQENAYQLCGLGYFYAKRGDHEFLKVLYDIVERNELSDDLGVVELLEIDQERGFLRVAAFRGKELKNREWDDVDRCLAPLAIEQFGETTALTLLSDSEDEDIGRFYDAWLARRKIDKERGPRYNQRERDRRRRSAEELIASAKSGRSMRFVHYRWGKYQSDEVMAVLAEALWSAEDPTVLTNYLAFFSERAMPRFDPRLIDFCSHEDEEVNEYAFKALAMMSHLEIRAFALEKVRQGVINGSVCSLFIRNYVPGDEEMILEALELSDDESLRHWVLAQIIPLLQKNQEANPLKLGLVVYRHTPCNYCRFKVIELLHARNRLPDWVRTECLHDSSEECMTLVQQIIDKPKSRSQ